MHLVTPQTMQAMDRRTIEGLGIPGTVLMDRAARGAVDALLDHFAPRPGADVGIVCGTGNNGGDGLAMATMLAHRGYTPRVVVLGERDALSGDATTYFDIADRLVDHLEIAPDEDAVDAVLADQPDCAVWCDGLLGTGIDRPVGGRYAVAVEFLRDQPAPVMAIDVPSGVQGRTGQILGVAAPAELTATFGFAKIGQTLDPARQYCGRLVVVDIGIPDRVRTGIGAEGRGLDADWLVDHVDRRPADAHKGDAGKSLHVGGRPETAGAIALSARGALVGGGGLITVATDRRSQPMFPTATPEVMARGVFDFEAGTIDDGEFRSVLEMVDTAAVGPGLGTDETARRALLGVLREGPDRLVADADALNLVAADADVESALESRAESGDVVLTPHPGEMARLRDCTIADVLADPLQSARTLADRLGVTVVLKTAASIVAAPDGRLAVNRTGNPGMATGGMGDALTGLLAASFAEADDGFQAACRATVLHGLAGDRAADDTGIRGLTVRRLLDEVPSVWQSVGA